MNFRNGSREEPEINLIPFIDILLVVLIFLMLTTTYNKFAELQVSLPVADAEQMREAPKEIVVTVAQDGRYAVNRRLLDGQSVDALVRAMSDAAAGQNNPVVIVSADAAAAHQAVINVMDAARRSGLNQITFATQSSGAR
ncbi:ExbD/TolR family protein [Hydrogenophaga aquatica]